MLYNGKLNKLLLIMVWLLIICTYSKYIIKICDRYMENGNMYLIKLMSWMHESILYNKHHDLIIFLLNIFKINYYN